MKSENSHLILRYLIFKKTRNCKFWQCCDIVRLSWYHLCLKAKVSLMCLLQIYQDTIWEMISREEWHT